ncbi:MAG: hypothetical protein M3137_05200 [Actinomycetota bacterium]|nr:hypothetical protein [Actinomycetota bacterium]
MARITRSTVGTVSSRSRNAARPASSPEPGAPFEQPRFADRGPQQADLADHPSASTPPSDQADGEVQLDTQILVTGPHPGAVQQHDRHRDHLGALLLDMYASSA